MTEVSISCTKSQLEAIETPLEADTLLNIIAGPGTGKTKTLVDRIGFALDNGIKPHEIIVFSLTRKTVEDFKLKMLDVFGEELTIGVDVSTFHSFCYNLVKLKIPNITHFSRTVKMEPDFIRDYYKIKENVNICRSYDEKYYKDLLQYDFPTIMASKAIRSKKEKENIFFDKCIMEAARIIKIDPSIVMNDCKLIIIDEFQDVSSIIMEFLKEIVKGKHLTISGDIDQSIYGFTGAIPSKNWGMMDKIYDKDHRLDLVLEDSFRLPQNLIKVATNTLQSDTTLLRSALKDEPEIYPFRVTFEDSKKEAEFINQEIDKLIQNSNGMIKPSNIAILSHSNASVDAFGFHLSMIGKYNVTKLKDEQSWKKSSLSMILDFLKLMDNPHDDDSLVSVCRHLSSVGPVTLRKIKEVSDSIGESIYSTVLDNPEVLDKKQLKLFFPFISYLSKLCLNKNDSNSIMFNLINLCSETNFKKVIESMPPAKIEKELVDLNMDFKIISKTLKENEGNNPTLIKYFIDNYDQTNFYKRLMKLDSDNAVTISTIHTSKGREWDIVFITSTLNDMRDMTAIAKDSNCNYVGITRAKHLLYYNKDHWGSHGYLDYKLPSTASNYHGTLTYLPHLKSKGTPNNLNELPKWISDNRGIDLPTVNKLISNMDIRRKTGINLFKRVYKFGKLI